ncbi:MAG: preprotein translocase subunit SecE [Chitinophagales bacterium]|jgi:preprotein translocase subunit SecE|nr:preprotein translocase subunit SecE [Chitinophagales bacterium]
MNKVIDYFRDSYIELTQHVTWTNWTELQRLTFIVIMSLIIISLVILLMDYISSGFLIKVIYNNL